MSLSLLIPVLHGVQGDVCIEDYRIANKLTHEKMQLRGMVY